MSPTLLAALIDQVGIPELVRWLASLHAQGKSVSEDEAIALLNTDVDSANASGLKFLQPHLP